MHMVGISLSKQYQLCRSTQRSAQYLAQQSEIVGQQYQLPPSSQQLASSQQLVVAQLARQMATRPTSYQPGQIRYNTYPDPCDATAYACAHTHSSNIHTHTHRASHSLRHSLRPPIVYVLRHALYLSLIPALRHAQAQYITASPYQLATATHPDTERATGQIKNK